MAKATAARDHAAVEAAPEEASIQVRTVDRNSRQLELYPPERLEKVYAVVIGLGAIGRPTALTLAQNGIPDMMIVDFDKVEPVNCGTQGYYPDQVGKLKTEATGEVCARIAPQCNITQIADRFDAKHLAGVPAGRQIAVFVCTDSIDSRRDIYNAVRRSADWVVDGRMAAEVYRILSFVPGTSDEIDYEKSLHTSKEAVEAPRCTYRSTSQCGNNCSSNMTEEFSIWLRNGNRRPNFLYDMLSNEIVVNPKDHADEVAEKAAAEAAAAKQLVAAS